MTDTVDPAAIMAEHQAVPHRKHWAGDVCATCVDPEYGQREVDHPCLPYRLAAGLVEAREREQRVTHYLAEQYGRLLAAHEQVVMDTDEDRDLHARVIETFREAVSEPVLAALTQGVSAHA